MENICSYASVKRIYREFRPDAIVYLSEIPSAPWSMNDYNAMETQYNNVQGTLATLLAMKNVCPDAHLIKLGTMGEYGTPSGTIIPEGNFPDGSRWRLSNGSDGGSLSGLPFPRSAGSWYHLSKVHDSYNVRFACNNYGLRSTDVMQGVVYGTRIDAMDNDPKLNTRFDIDECFGTAINRFCAQAVICHPITVYGLGNQKRGFLSLRDSIQCLQLSIDNPPSKGEYRVFNQFDEVYS
jgi:UDP-sulfoquinovose synthase